MVLVCSIALPKIGAHAGMRELERRLLDSGGVCRCARSHCRREGLEHRDQVLQRSLL